MKKRMDSLLRKIDELADEYEEMKKEEQQLVKEFIYSNELHRLIDIMINENMLLDITGVEIVRDGKSVGYDEAYIGDYDVFVVLKSNGNTELYIITSTYKGEGFLPDKLVVKEIDNIPELLMVLEDILKTFKLRIGMKKELYKYFAVSMRNVLDAVDKLLKTMGV